MRAIPSYSLALAFSLILSLSPTASAQVSWTSRSAGATYVNTAVHWTGSQWLIGNEDGRIYASPEGMNWSQRSYTGTRYPIRSMATGTKTVAVGKGGMVLSSADGITWTYQNLACDDLYSVAWTGSRFVAVGGSSTFQLPNIFISTDGSTWTVPTFTASDSKGLSAVVANGSTVVAMESTGRAYYSSNGGTSWTRIDAGMGTMNGAAWNGSKFAAVGDAGKIFTSPDGIAWTAQTSGVATSLAGITWTGRVFAAVGDQGVVLTSSDGIAWTGQTTGTAGKIASIGVAKGQFLAGSLATVLASAATLGSPLAVPSYAGSPYSFGQEATLSPVVPTVPGGTAPTAYSIAPALPDGLSLDPATGAISGKPTYWQSATKYLVFASAGGDTAFVPISITVLPQLSNLSYLDNVGSYYQGVAIRTNTPTVSGTATSYAVAAGKTLPAGLSLDAASGNITGTPTAIAAVDSFTITASNSFSSTSKVISIKVMGPPTGLAYGGTAFKYYRNVAITPLNPTISGGPVMGYSANPALPAGLSFSASGVLTGTPTATSAAASYTFTATNPAGSSSCVLVIEVIGAPSGPVYAASTAEFGVGKAVNVAAPTNAGSVTGYSVNPALPAGLSLDAATGAIGGTPTAAQAAADYVVTATNPSGTATATLRYSVVAPPASVAYASTSEYLPVNAAIIPKLPTVSGSVSGYSVSPSLPAGLAFNVSTGAITGTPTAPQAVVSYTISAHNAAGSVSVILKIGVVAAPTALSYPAKSVTYGQNVPITLTAPTLTGAAITFSVNPPLPAGLILDAATGALSGTPSAAQGSATYAITASNAAGSITFSLTLAVVAPPSGLQYPGLLAEYPVNAPIAKSYPIVLGPVTVFSVSPALPLGLVLDTATGVISGTPAKAQGVVTYTITAVNIAGKTTASFALKVGTGTGLGRDRLAAGPLPGTLWKLFPVDYAAWAGARIRITDPRGRVVRETAAEPDRPLAGLAPASGAFAITFTAPRAPGGGIRLTRHLISLRP